MHDCGHDEDLFCPGSGSLDVAAVVCVDEQADLEPDIYDLMSSAHLEDKQLFFLQVDYAFPCSVTHRMSYEMPMHRFLTQFPNQD